MTPEPESDALPPELAARVEAFAAASDPGDALPPSRGLGGLLLPRRLIALGVQPIRVIPLHIAA